MERIEDLERLQKLKESGALTEAEFESEKAKILNEETTVKESAKAKENVEETTSVSTTANSVTSENTNTTSNATSNATSNTTSNATSNTTSNTTQNATQNTVATNTTANKEATNVATVPNTTDKKAIYGMVGFILGLSSILAWIIPLLGYPTTITGIVFSTMGLKSKNKVYALTGLILSIVFLVLTLINSIAGAVLNSLYYL